MGRAGPGGLPLRREARPVRLAPHEAAGRRRAGCRTTSTGSRASARTLGPNLVQLPPRWKRNTARLDEFLDAAPPRLRWAVEVRDPTWLHDDVYDVLARHGAALCIHDLLDDHPWVLHDDWTYVRFHGPDALEDPYQGRYSGRRLWRPARRLAAWLDDGVDVYAYFNNDFDGHAWADAQWLRARLTASATPAADRRRSRA